MGTVVAALIVPLLVAGLGWRWAFVITGVLALLVLVAWRIVYCSPEQDTRLSADEYRYIKQDQADRGEDDSRVAFQPILRTRQLWVLASARAITDPVWAFLLYWLPDFFHKRHGFDLAGYGPPLIAVYLLGDIGSIGGGWLSSALLRRGWSVNVARKTALFLSALAVLPATVLTSIDAVWLAVLILGVIAGAHQSWSITLYTIVSDVFPRRAVATAVSLCSAVYALTTVVMIKFVGATLQATGNYSLLFAMVGVAYLIAFGLVCLFLPRADSVDLSPQRAAP